MKRNLFQFRFFIERMSHWNMLHGHLNGMENHRKFLLIFCDLNFMNYYLCVSYRKVCQMWRIHRAVALTEFRVRGRNSISIYVIFDDEYGIRRIQKEGKWNRVWYDLNWYRAEAETIFFLRSFRIIKNVLCWFN